MLSINILDEKLVIKSIDKNSIKDVYNIYNNVNDFKYATGLYKRIDYTQFSNQLAQFILKENSFFLTLYTYDNQLVGFIKGSIIKKNKMCWVNSLVIDTAFQRKGMGKRAILSLHQFFKYNMDVDKLYLSVATSNIAGLSFWTKCGFVKCDEIYKNTLNINKQVLIMWKNL